LLSLRGLKYGLGGHADNIDDELQLLSFVGSWEQREPGVKFNHDAAEAPHVDLLGVREQPQNDVGGSVESALDVGVHDLVLQATGPEVGYHDAALIFALQQDVFWLQVTVDDAEVLHVAEGREQLNGESPDQAVFEALVVVHLYEFVQVN